MSNHRLDLWRVRLIVHDRSVAATFSVLGGWFVCRQKPKAVKS